MIEAEQRTISEEQYHWTYCLYNNKLRWKFIANGNSPNFLKIKCPVNPISRKNNKRN